MAHDTKTPLHHDDVVHLFRDIPDWKIAAILNSGASLEELELAMAWRHVENDVAGKARQPLAGPAARLYQILLGNCEHWEGDR